MTESIRGMMRAKAGGVWDHALPQIHAPLPKTKQQSDWPLRKAGQDAPADLGALDARHEETVKRDAEKYSNFFVIGERKFTIFKDSSGQYITRYTSLKDGSITYVPEPALIGLRQAHHEEMPSMLAVEA